MDPLGPLPSRSGVDVDLAFQWVIRSSETQLAFASTEKRLEYLGKVGLNSGERLYEHGASGAVDLPDCLHQGVTGAHQVISLRGQELQPFALFGVLLDRERIHRTD